MTKALESIGKSILGISAIFVTHEHIDHIRGLEVISKKFRIPVYINGLSADYILADGAYENLSRCAVIKNAGESVSVGNMCVDIFKTPHDSLGSVCFHISDTDGDTFGLATDIGYVTKGIAAALIGCRQVVVESQHDLDMLKKRTVSVYAQTTHSFRQRTPLEQGLRKIRAVSCRRPVRRKCGLRIFRKRTIRPQKRSPKVRRRLKKADFAAVR